MIEFLKTYCNITVVIAIVVPVCTVIYFILQNKFKVKEERLNSIINNIQRKINKDGFLDLSKIIFSLKNNQEAPSNGKYFINDKFYASEDNYWQYKYSNPLEKLFLLKNIEYPEFFQNINFDSPIHLWIGKLEYTITDKEILNKINESCENSSFKIEDNNGYIFNSDRIIFKPIIELSRYKLSDLSIRLRTIDDLSSDKFIEISSYDKLKCDELLGISLKKEIDIYYKDEIDPNTTRNFLRATKNENVIHAEFCTTFHKIEIDNIIRTEFYNWLEIIIICTNTYIYTLKIESPSLEPSKREIQFTNINKWFADFGVVIDD